MDQSSTTKPRGNGANVRGSRSGNFSRGGGRGGQRGRGGKKRDMGRGEYNKQKGDKRKRNDDQDVEKRQKVEKNGDEAPALPIYATKFDEETLKNEERRPKKKVAVMIGYSGTGYKGMQMAPDVKTIEGDLFQAFVAAGAISKANADDPKKSSFVRCARTDKGVHAAGNIISLKLIVEDEDIVERINKELTPQIRVWGFERTNNSFSAYQLCDSRIYEYLIPTHSFLPPHPRSWLGRKCAEWAEREGKTDEWKVRQEEVEGYWDKVDNESIKPILDAHDDEEIRDILDKALWLRAEEDAAKAGDDVEEGGSKAHRKADDTTGGAFDSVSDMTSEQRKERAIAINEGCRKLRQAYHAAKREFRLPKARLDRIREVLQLYLGTRNFHNYTVHKDFKDPSAKRVIKSFVVDSEPVIIENTEWLSLKVHGQSFMMHQIRKMVGMAALVVRCGCDPQRIVESYGSKRISIPKAPSLGLLLERPVFDSYNKRAKSELGKERIDFDKYKKEMDEFKQREIYDRMHQDEEKDNVFGTFFNHLDNYPTETFLFITAGGLDATKRVDIDANDTAKDEMKKAPDPDIDGDEDSDGAGDGYGNEG